MYKFSDPVTQGALLILVLVVLGTLLLVAMAFVRRWQQIRYARSVHELRREYRPVLAALMRGENRAAGIESLRELPLQHIEILVEPVLTKHKVSERRLKELQSACVELGLISLWQRRAANGNRLNPGTNRGGSGNDASDAAHMRHLMRAKSIQNLGKLRHRGSWEVLVGALDDDDRDIQMVALRALAAVEAEDSFPVLTERLQAALEGRPVSHSLHSLRLAMGSFDLRCAGALAPCLHHHNRRVRLHAIEVLKTMVYREYLRHPDLILSRENVSTEILDLLLTRLPTDHSAEIRARAAEVMVFVSDARVYPTLSELIRDNQWFVRLRSVRALAHLRRTTTQLHFGIRECLHDPHWRVREAAIQTLIALGKQGKQHLYQHFLTSSDSATRRQIVEVIERTGLMAALVADYCQGSNGLTALMVEHLAGDAAPVGISGILRSMNPDARQTFIQRLLPQAPASTLFQDCDHPTQHRNTNLLAASPGQSERQNEGHLHR